MNNIFLKNSVRHAADIIGKRPRLLRLVTQLMGKLRHVNWDNVNAQTAIKARLSLFGRISKAYALGHYRDIPWKTLLIIVGAILYFIDPFDFIPDLIPVAGFTDDFSILVWVYSAVNKEIVKFIEWEKTRITISETRYLE